MQRIFSRWPFLPEVGEPSFGYFARLVAAEGHHSATVYAHERGAGRFPNFRKCLDAVLELPLKPCARDRLLKATPRQVGGKVFINSQSLKLHQYNRQLRRHCPRCIQEAPFHRIWWNLPSYQKCHEHGLLVSETKSSNRMATWSWPRFDWSPLGENWALSPHVDGGSTDWSRYIVGRLGFADRTPAPLLDKATLSDAIDAVETLSRLLSNPKLDKAPTGTADYDVGFLPLSGSLSDLEEYLRKWMFENSSQSERDLGKRATFGWFTRYEKRGPTERMIDLALSRVIAKNGRMRRSPTGQYCVAAEDEIHLSDAAEKLGLKKKGVVEIASYLGVRFRRDYSRHHKVMSLDQFEKVAIARRRLIRSDATTAVTGLPFGDFSQIARRHRLHKFTQCNMGDSKFYFYDRLQIDVLISSLTEGMSAVDKGVPTVSLRSFARREGVSVVKVLDKIKSKKLRPLGRDCRLLGLDQLRFNTARDVVKTDPGRWKLHLDPSATTWKQFTDHLEANVHKFKGIAATLPDGRLWMNGGRTVGFRFLPLVGGFQIKVEFHPTSGARRWRIMQQHRSAIEQALPFARWEPHKNTGLAIIFDARQPFEVESACLMVQRLMQFFSQKKLNSDYRDGI